MMAGKDYGKALSHAQANANRDGKPRWLHSYGGRWWISPVDPNRAIEGAELVLPVSALNDPADRLAAYLAVFGWRGGTIHQVRAATGILDVMTLLYGQAKTGEPEYHRGFFMAKAGPLTEGIEAGNVQFWLGAMAYHLTRKVFQTPEPSCQ